MTKNVIAQALHMARFGRLMAGKGFDEGDTKFQILVDAIPGYASFQLDPDGLVANWSRAAERLTGWSPDEITGRSFSILFTEQDIAKGAPAMELDNARVNGRYETSGVRLRKDGVPLQAQVVVIPLYDSGGELRRFIEIIRDITAQRDAEAELAASEARLRAVVETAVDAIIVIGEDGVIQSFNSAAERAFGYSAGEIIGRNVSELMPEPHRSAHDIYLARYRETGEAKVIGRGREVEARRNDGTVFPAELAVAEWKVGERRCYTGIIRDITERKQAEERVRFVIRELSHRTKNMLAVIQAMAWQTARTCGDFKEFDKRFTSRLQGLARSQDLLVKGDWRGVLLSELARMQLVPFLDDAEFRLLASGPEVFLKPEMAQDLGLTLHELATNALKYGALSSPGGRIRVRWLIAGEHFLMEWEESGGPPVAPPQHKGFGHMVFHSLESSECKIELEYAPGGVRWRLIAPVSLALSA